MALAEIVIEDDAHTVIQEAGGSLEDIVRDLYRDGHIGERLAVSGYQFLHDLRAYHGSSAGLIMAYGERMPSGSEPHARLPRLGDTQSAARLGLVLKSLRNHERALLRHCVTARETDRGTLADWGRQHSGYETAKTARAAATGQIRAMLSTIAEIYDAWRPG